MCQLSLSVYRYARSKCTYEYCRNSSSTEHLLSVVSKCAAGVHPSQRCNPTPPTVFSSAPGSQPQPLCSAMSTVSVPVTATVSVTASPLGVAAPFPNLNLKILIVPFRSVPFPLLGRVRCPDGFSPFAVPDSKTRKTSAVSAAYGHLANFQTWLPEIRPQSG